MAGETWRSWFGGQKSMTMEEFARADWRRVREHKIEEARRAGLQFVVLPVFGGGEEQIDLRVH